MINIIIPAYNSHKTIEKTIASIAVQTISDQIEIILVDDGSDYGYEEIIKKFQNLIKIKYIKHKVNLGVGFARQTGLDAVDQSYFGFADSDDFYTDAFAFEEMLNKIKKTKNAMIWSKFIYEEKNKQYKYNQNISSTCGALYRTNFIQENGIKFPKQNINEDVIFNHTIYLILKNDISKMQLFNKTVYLAKYSENSLTKKNREQFFYRDSILFLLKGIETMASNNNIPRENWNNFLVQVLFRCYLEYYNSKNNAQKKLWYKEILEASITFFKEYVRPQNIIFDHNLINKTTKETYDGQTIKEYQTFQKFLKLIKE